LKLKPSKDKDTISYDHEAGGMGGTNIFYIVWYLVTFRMHSSQSLWMTKVVAIVHWKWVWFILI